MSLNQTEIETIALYMGYTSNEVDYNTFVTDLNDTQISFIRASLSEIERIETLIKDAVTNSQASRVEQIDVNIDYRSSLIGAAAYEVIKISKYIRYPIRKNLYSVEDLPRMKQEDK